MKNKVKLRMCGLLFEYDVRLSVKLYFTKSYMNIRTILRQFLTASFVLPTFPKTPENGLNTEVLSSCKVKLKKMKSDKTS